MKIKNNEIRKEVISKVKGNFLVITSKISLLQLIALILSITFYYLMVKLGEKIPKGVIEGCHSIIIFISYSLITWSTSIITLKFLRDDKKMSVPLILNKIGLKFIILDMILSLKMMGWIIVTLIPSITFIIMRVISYPRKELKEILGGINPDLVIGGYIITSIIFLIYKWYSYSFSLYSFIDNEGSSYTKAIKTSIFLMKGEKLKFTRFNLENIFFISVIPSLLIWFLLRVKISNMWDRSIQTVLTLGIIYLYNLLITIPSILILNTEYYLQLKEKKFENI